MAYGWRSCPTCKGSGLQPKAGKVPYDNNDYAAFSWNDCHTCGGRGETWQYVKDSGIKSSAGKKVAASAGAAGTGGGFCDATSPHSHSSWEAVSALASLAFFVVMLLALAVQRWRR